MAFSNWYYSDKILTRLIDISDTLDLLFHDEIVKKKEVREIEERWKPSDVDKKLLRLKKIAESAAQQSRRTFLPKVLAPVKASDILEVAAVAEPGGRALTANDRMVAIGPEGGWSSAELAVAGDRVMLGPNVLRTETAATAAAALCVAAHH